MRYVAQELPYSCGIACLAMVTDQTHAEVLADLAPALEGRKGLHELFLMHYLAVRGWSWQLINRVYHGSEPNMRRTLWPPRAWAERHIVEVRVPSGYHFVVMDGAGRVLDPFDQSRTSLEHPDYLEVMFVMSVYPGAAQVPT